MTRWKRCNVVGVVNQRQIHQCFILITICSFVNKNAGILLFVRLSRRLRLSSFRLICDLETPLNLALCLIRLGTTISILLRSSQVLLDSTFYCTRNKPSKKITTSQMKFCFQWHLLIGLYIASQLERRSGSAPTGRPVCLASNGQP